MSETSKTKQKKSLAVRIRKNDKNMFSLTARIKETKTKQNDQVRQIKSTEKISKTRSKQILKNYSAKPKSGESKTVYKEIKVGIIRSKNSKKAKANKYTRSNKIIERKPETFPSAFFLTQLRKSYESQICRQCSPKDNFQTKSPGVTPPGSAKKTIFVSLDFIEDCHLYKKKFMKPMCDQELKIMRKSLRNISSYHKRYLNNTEQIQIFHRDNHTHKRIQSNKNLSQRKMLMSSSSNSSEQKALEFFPAEDSTNADPVDNDANKTPNELPVSDELSSQSKKSSAETFSVEQASNVKASLKDVSTVDKKYLELLRSLANCNETKQKLQMKNKESKYKERDKGLVESEKKKISGKTFFENKIKKEKLEKEKQLEQTGRKLSETEKKSTELKNATSVSQEGTVFARLVRDLTKSEMQILPRKRNNPQSSRNSETQRAKKTAHSKPEVNDNRKKRKTRNNVLKNNNDDNIEVPFPCEISKVADLKELWRRGSRKKSENSLSSRSSSTTLENEEFLESKNLGLESYKILRKIVEEEVKTICKNFVEEKPEDIFSSEKENDQEECVKESANVKKMCKELRTIMSENVSDIFDTNGNKTDEVVNGKQTFHNEEQKFNPNCEGKKERDDFLKYLDKHETKDLDPNLLEEKKNQPGEVVKNWSILHRLERAFLALGTPTFPNHKIKDSKALKSTGTKALKTTSEDVKHPQESVKKSENHQKNNLEKQEKKRQKISRAASPKHRRDASENWKSKLTPTRTALQSSRNARTESVTKQPLQKARIEGTSNIGVTRSRQQRPAALNPRKTSESEEKSKLKKAKSQSQKPISIESKKSPQRSVAKLKVCEIESRYLKRDVKQKKFKHAAPTKNPISAKNKPDAKAEVMKKEPPITLEPDQKDNENLERKKTFDVIPSNASLKIKPRKSKSFNKIEDRPELDSTKKCFPQIRSGDAKNLNVWDFSELKQNLNEKNKTDISKTKPDVTQKTALKCKPSQPHDRPKTACEKECSKGNRETPPKTAMDRICQEKRLEKVIPEVDFSGQMLAKEINKSKDRAVKERSILSIPGNQQADQTQRKSFLHLPGKDVGNLAQEGSLISRPVVRRFEEGTLKGMEAQGKARDILGFQPCASTSTFDVTDEISQDSPPEVCPRAENTTLSEEEILEELSSLSNLSVYALEQQQDDERVEVKFLKRQPIWEKDIKQYRAIVREIMSQYKRIDGFLKQNEHPQSFPNDSVSLMLKKEATSDNGSDLSRNSPSVNIYEYRRKILSEYQALPIFEYKTKIQQEANNTKLEEKRRNLAFVKALKTEMDLDVKDFQPNIQKILDSQLYVDMENVLKRKEPCVKFTEKKSSLQEIVTNKNEKTIKEEECPRSISTPKTFLSLAKEPVHSSSVQDYSDVNINSEMGIKTQALKI